MKSGLKVFGLIGAVALATAQPLPAHADEVILAKVVERQFLYSIGLSTPGTLGVGQVRYQLEVVEQWGSNEQPRQVQILSDGGCPQLLQEQQRYLITLSGQLVESASGEPLNVMHCDGTPEAEAKEAIAALNAEREQRPL